MYGVSDCHYIWDYPNTSIQTLTIRLPNLGIINTNPWQRGKHLKENWNFHYAHGGLKTFYFLFWK